MKKQGLLLIVVLLTCLIFTHAQTSQQVDLHPLRNNDILQMVADGHKSVEIIEKILKSNCNFDIFPPVLRDLSRRGVPDTVLLAMTMVPTGPPKLGLNEPVVVSLTTPVHIPAGTMIEVESAQAVSSARVSEGSPITFLVTKRIFVNNLLVIERGARARAKIVKVKRSAGFGRPGMLAWAMEYVVAVDGTHIPLTVSGEQRGTNRMAAVAGGALATGALLFPYTSPVALIWGLKKGDDAVLRGSKIFKAAVQTDTKIAGLQPRPGGVVYHDMDTVKASAAPPTITSFPRGSMRPGGFRPH